ncbi:hypothetical protein PHYSODRAFT_355041 [Phytophthora sojae]|uniref:RxLR effector protein Avh52 n=1 Tax=Phytophthora sojae (strain P6497) TaxID=1094619 RepID=AVH52_PHYSP|nr:hypothetical protein PHYSODRAFT_355041 [Phytophthora sojae]G4ZSG0.1 RecName: Full=RxLR effector protein Avh52; AltName: Full=Avirulence homolog protein 52; Flags: Precursor [Phytophthora sojae strain P6497]EGZ14040.1 hypothetical protein PHYSODRAFT_355041 [Phytophthora sojae]|eukprot:XP_009531469.1 hypothetical protein PHYSODRAFT_355041 [Phytophthora sojae]
MRLTSILVLVIAATFHTTGTALTLTKDSKAGIANGDSPASGDFIDANSARLLRRVEKDKVDYEQDEQRSFGALKDAVKKLNPVTAVKKFFKQRAKRKKVIQTARDADNNLAWAMKEVYKAAN